MKNKFIFKLVRNSLILSVTYFFSTFASFSDFSPDEWKPLIIFVGIYISSELGHHYHVSTTQTKGKLKVNTFIF